jgi:hypothetical protein
MAFTNKQELVDAALALIVATAQADNLFAVANAEAARVVASISRVLPRHVSHAFNGTGSATRYPTSGTLLTLTVPWVQGFSFIDWIEHPTGDRPRTYLDESEWWYYPSPETATYIEFDTAPATGTANLLLGYTVLWSVTDSASNVPDHLEPGFEYALACAVCRVVAAKYAHSGSSTIEGDSVNYGSKSGEWRSLADTFCESASTALGVDISSGGGAAAGEASAPAGGFLEWDVKSQPWGDPLFLTRRQR